MSEDTCQSHEIRLTAEQSDWLMDYLKHAKPDPAKAARAEEDRRIVSQFVRLEDLKNKNEVGRNGEGR